QPGQQTDQGGCGRHQTDDPLGAGGHTEGGGDGGGEDRCQPLVEKVEAAEGGVEEPPDGGGDGQDDERHGHDPGSLVGGAVPVAVAVASRPGRPVRLVVL